MAIPRDPITLADWRRTVAGLYARIRESGPAEAAGAAQTFRAARDRLFAHHPDSPIPPGRRAAWRGASWFDYDPAWRVSGEFAPAGHIAHFEIPLADDGVVRCARVGTVRFRVREHEAQLAVYWFEGYGGGLWLPFTDGTSGDSTYGGGRYLYDTIKGADLGAAPASFVLDFNFAYHPSCAYDERWSCPLAPRENRLAFSVTAGERMAQ